MMLMTEDAQAIEISLLGYPTWIVVLRQGADLVKAKRLAHDLGRRYVDLLNSLASQLPANTAAVIMSCGGKDGADQFVSQFLAK